MQEKEGIQVDQIRLIYAGKQLYVFPDLFLFVWVGGWWGGLCVCRVHVERGRIWETVCFFSLTLVISSLFVFCLYPPPLPPITLCPQRPASFSPTLTRSSLPPSFNPQGGRQDPFFLQRRGRWYYSHGPAASRRGQRVERMREGGRKGGREGVWGMHVEVYRWMTKDGGE